MLSCIAYFEQGRVYRGFVVYVPKKTNICALNCQIVALAMSGLGSEGALVISEGIS